MLATDYDDNSATRFVEGYFNLFHDIAERNEREREELLARVCEDFPRPVHNNDAKGVWIRLQGGDIMHMAANIAYTLIPSDHPVAHVGYVHNASHVVESFNENDDTRRLKALWLQGKTFWELRDCGPYLHSLGESKEYCAPFALSVTCRYSGKEAHRDNFRDYIKFSTGKTQFFTYGENKYGTEEHPYVTDLAAVYECDFKGMFVYDSPEPIPLYASSP